MSLEKVQFDKIIDLLVKAYMDCAKEHIRMRNGHRSLDVPFDQEPNSEQLFQSYFDTLKTVYTVNSDAELPAIYREASNIDNRIEQTVDTWSVSRRALVGLRPLNLNAIAQQLNQDFSEQHALSDQYHINNRQAMMLTFMLSDQPTLMQQLVTLSQDNRNKILIALMILSAVLSAVCSICFLIPTAIGALGLFAQLKKPGHREKFYQHAVAHPASDLNSGESFQELARAERMLASF